MDVRPVSILAVVLALVALTLAGLVLAARPRARMNRAVCLLLATTALVGLASTWRHEAVLPDRIQYALASQFYLGAASIGPVYLWVLSALPGRLTNWLRIPGVMPASLLLPLTALVVFVVNPDHPHALSESIGAVRGDAMTPWAVVGVLVSLYGLVAAYDAWRTETLPATRRMAASFLVAFGVRDVVMVVALGLNGYNGFTESLPALDDPHKWGGFANNLTQLADVVFVPALAYAVLRMQWLDFRWQLRLTISKATLVTVFVAAIVATFEVGTDYLEGWLGTLPTIAVTTALILFLGPLQRISERVSARAVPHAKPLEALPDDEKSALYVEQVQLAWQDGMMSAAERRMLDGMAERLGLSTPVAAQLEKRALA